LDIIIHILKERVLVGFLGLQIMQPACRMIDGARLGCDPDFGLTVVC